MKANTTDIHRAESLDAIRPLLGFCRAGELFAVQEWIAANKPVNGPPLRTKGTRSRTPLEVAIDAGFYSLVELLLKAGAVIEPEGWRSPMYRALALRRLDVIKLLVDHGFDVRTVDMHQVFNSWDPEVISYFIEQGADLVTGRPLASALCRRIRTAVGVFKHYREQFPFLNEHANIALRHHCKEGNLKWVSLLLWAGADPYAPGSDSPDKEPEAGDNGLCALGYAALYDHPEVLRMRQIRLDPADARIRGFVRYLCGGKCLDELKNLLENGLNPNDQQSGGCSGIQYSLERMSWPIRLGSSGFGRSPWSTNSTESMECLRAIHLLAKYGGKWIPNDRDEINQARRSLVQLAPDFTVEFVWIMAKYRACAVECLKQLVGTSKIKSHTSVHQHRIAELIAAWS